MPTSHDNRRGTHSPETRSVREVCFIPLDPVLDAFHGVVVEFYERDPGSSRPYLVLKSAALSGNVIPHRLDRRGHRAEDLRRAVQERRLSRLLKAARIPSQAGTELGSAPTPATALG